MEEECVEDVFGNEGTEKCSAAGPPSPPSWVGRFISDVERLEKKYQALLDAGVKDVIIPLDEIESHAITLDKRDGFMYSDEDFMSSDDQLYGDELLAEEASSGEEERLNLLSPNRSHILAGSPGCTNSNCIEQKQLFHSQLFEQYLSLCNWHVMFTEHGSLIVLGQKEQGDMELWHSSPIGARVEENPRLVQTSSGSRYALIGSINESEMQNKGFCSDFIATFKNGFPHDWKQLASEHFVHHKASIQEQNEVCDTPQDLEKRQVPVLMTDTQIEAIRPSSRVPHGLKEKWRRKDPKNTKKQELMNDNEDIDLLAKAPEQRPSIQFNKSGYLLSKSDANYSDSDLLDDILLKDQEGTTQGQYGTTPYSNMSVNTSSEFRAPFGSSASRPTHSKTKEIKSGNTPIGLNPRRKRSTFEKRRIPESEMSFQKSKNQNSNRKSKRDESNREYPDSQNSAASDDELNSTESINVSISNAKKVSFSLKKSALISSDEHSCEVQPQVGIGSVTHESQQRFLKKLKSQQFHYHLPVSDIDTQRNIHRSGRKILPKDSATETSDSDEAEQAVGIQSSNSERQREFAMKQQLKQQKLHRGLKVKGDDKRQIGRRSKNNSMLTDPANEAEVSDESEQQLQRYFRSGKPKINRKRSGKQAVHQRPKSQQLRCGLSARRSNTKVIVRRSETSESESFDSDDCEKQQEYHNQSDSFEMQKSDDSDMSVRTTRKHPPDKCCRETDDLSDTPNSGEGSKEQKSVVNCKDGQQGRKITSSKKNEQWLEPKHKMCLRSKTKTIARCTEQRTVRPFHQISKTPQTTERLVTDICTRSTRYRSCKRHNEKITNVSVNKKNKGTRNAGVKTRGNKENLQNNEKKTSYLEQNRYESSEEDDVSTECNRQPSQGMKNKGRREKPAKSEKKTPGGRQNRNELLDEHHLLNESQHKGNSSQEVLSQQTKYCCDFDKVCNVLEESYRQNREESKCKVQQLDDTAEWTPEELESLQRVLSQLPPSVPLFWQKVATYVGSRSPASCQAKAEELKQPKKQGRPHQSTKRPAKEKAKADTKPAGLSIEEIAKLRKGTVRRKQGLRELVKRQDENYEDNIWDSTPYREQKKKIKLPFDVPQVDDLDDTLINEEHSGILATPAFISPYSRRHSSASCSATPLIHGPSYVSPSLLRSINRNHMDSYINKLKKDDKDRRKVPKHNPQKPRQRQPEPQMFRETFSSSVFSKDTLPRRNFIDEVDEESDEEDCYWGED